MVDQENEEKHRGVGGIERMRGRVGWMGHENESRRDVGETGG